MSSGAAWWLRFLRAHNVHAERAWFAIGCRESGPSSNCLYPSGAPWGDWEHGKGRHFDTGVLQINDRWLDVVKAEYGPTANMSIFLNPETSLKFALKHLHWSDWGLEIVLDATNQAKSYSFNWSGWPSPYTPGESGAVSAEAGFTEWWDAYPALVTKVFGAGNVAPHVPVPKPVVKPVPKPVASKPMLMPTVVLSRVQPGKSGSQVLLVQKALAKAVGLDYSSGPGVFGPRTRQAYAVWQGSLGFKGGSADGVPGLLSLRRLGDKYGFKVVA